MFAARNMMFAGVSAAGAYIAAVETALGSSITSTQKDALNAFVLAEQAAGRWTSHKRLYLPIWANAAANALCLKSLRSGTFVGGVTHAAGYVQGNGSSGYFNFTENAAALGISRESGLMFAMPITAPANDYAGMIGARNGSNSQQTGIMHNKPGNSSISGVGTSAGGFSAFGSTSNSGLYMISRVSAIRQRAHLMKTSGFTSGPIQSTASDLTITANNLYALGLNGEAIFASSARQGPWGCGLGLSDQDCADFAANLKTLWETCTGLTLP